MAEYLGTLVAVGAVVAFAGFVSYGGECEKYVKNALGVILLSCFISPLVSLVGSLSSFDSDKLFDFSEGDISIEDSLYYKTAEENFCIGIEKLLGEEMKIDEEDIEVHTSGFDMTEMKAEKIVIILSGKGAYADYRGVQTLISSSGLGECEVKLEFG